jgi:sugar phosphate isomerase/epimerase
MSTFRPDAFAAGMTRRGFMAAVGGVCAASWTGAFAAAGTTTSVGLATDVWGIHNKAQAAGGQKGEQSDPLAFLDRCQEFGAGGMQGPLGIRDNQYTARLRRAAEQRQLYVEGSIMLLGEKLDAEAIEKQIVTAKDAGATVVRTVVIPGRRYEYFTSAEQFAKASERALAALRLAEPIAARHRMRIAVENHKCHRVAERLEMLKKLSSEWVGMCVDMGNSFSLCEDPLEAVKAYAPYAYSVHVKDQAVREYESGFLFGDAPLGQGFLDLPAMVRVLREARREVRFSLEVITRDPLQVPVLTPRYWATMPDVPASDLARTMATVKAKSPREALPTISQLSIEKQVECESRNIAQSLVYARERLGL